MQSSAHLGYLDRNIIKINRCQRECMSRALHHHHRREHTATVTENNFLVAKPQHRVCACAPLFGTPHGREARRFSFTCKQPRNRFATFGCLSHSSKKNQGT
ncbi:hypothetical protein CDAR_272621 [Caerostris darwini]|uniref:Uncharacterized protein n=1 Tax=Caerostris darwini TaxID=1538125 RepID=A0AAV4UZJ6_9ARAC|nr:hypothetical protein CDAR_272621 [Caerostris darwini]